MIFYLRFVSQICIIAISSITNIPDAIVYAMKREGFMAEAVYDGEEALKKIDLF